MRGGISYAELLERFSADDREAFNEVIKENIEMTKLTKMPLI